VPDDNTSKQAEHSHNSPVPRFVFQFVKIDIRAQIDQITRDDATVVFGHLSRSIIRNSKINFGGKLTPCFLMIQNCMPPAKAKSPMGIRTKCVPL
jgi:hypothetical protein